MPQHTHRTPPGVAAVEPETVTPLSPRRLGWFVVMGHEWRDVTFLHWAIEPARAAPLFPPGVRPDVHEGATYVGLVPFRMVGAGLGPRHPVPYFGSFPETNVRLYSVDDQGRRGVVFLSLDASRLATALGARVAYGLPYMWSRMHVGRREDAAGPVFSYSTWRRWPGPRGGTSRVVVRVGERLAQASPLDAFLTARWGLHHRHAGRSLYTPNDHEEWPLHRAEVIDLDDGLVAAAGLPGVTDRPPDHVHWAPAVRARFGLPLPGEATLS